MTGLVKFLVGLGIFFLFAFSIYGWVVGFNNTAVEFEQDGKTSWSNVETAYQRRNDLIGNLVSTVKGAADFEKSTLTAVIEARAKATAVTIDPSNVTPEKLAEFQKSQSGVSSALSRLLVSIEAYPQLRANENFLKLQTELEGTENRIGIARTNYNSSARIYNIHIKKFPGSFLANLFNFKELPYFKADEGAEKAPKVEFNF